MSVYQLIMFDGVPLPLYDPAQDQSTGTVDSTLLDSVGGVFDYYGPGQRLPRRQVLTVAGLYYGAEKVYEVDEDGDFLLDHTGAFILIAEAEGDLRGQVDALTAKIGALGQLIRKRWDDETVKQWRTARLLSVRRKTSKEQRIVWAECECTFDCVDATWHDDTLATAAKTCTADANNSMTVAVDGNVTVQDGVFTYTPSATATAVRVRCTAQGVDWTYTGSLGVGSELVVDAGNQTVKLTGVDSYSGFALNSGHTADRWLPLAPGNNTVTVNPTGGGGTAKIERYDQWV